MAPTDRRENDGFIHSLLTQILSQVSEIGPLKERMNSFVDLMERVETRASEEMVTIKNSVGDHETRIRVLEAVSKERDGRDGESDKIWGGVWKSVGGPLLVSAIGALVTLAGVGYMMTHQKPVNITSGPTFNQGPPSGQ